MPITQQHAQIVARAVVDGYNAAHRDYDEHADPRVSEALWRATMEAMERVALAAPDETLMDVKSSYSYKAALRVTVKVTLLIATDRSVWIVRHDEGQAQEPLGVPYDAVRPEGKRLTTSVKVEHRPDGVAIIAGRKTAEWLQSLQTQRPTQTAAWLTGDAASSNTNTPAAQPPPGWHRDPLRRHEFRWWDGARWTEHISNEGVQGVDPVPQ